MGGDNAAGERLGHVLLAIVRFVCGTGVGLLIWLWLASDLTEGGWLLLIACIAVPGLLAVLFGDRFFDWFLAFFFGD